MNEIYDTVIIGSGPAGLTAAIYNIRSALKTVVIAGDQPGGQLTITTTVDNYPGFPTGIGGTKLMMDTQTQVKNLGGEIKNGLVKSVKPIPNPSLDRAGRFAVELENRETLNTKAVIVATGAGAKWLQIPKEKELIGRGISGCATCDGMFFRNKTVAIVGGGDVACEEAYFLTKFATKVYMIVRRDVLRAQVPQQKLVENNPKIEFIWNSEVIEINPNPSPADAGAPLDKGALNSEKLESIKIKNNKTGEEKILPLDGLFVAIGRIPGTDFVKDLVELKETGQIVTGKNPDYLTMSLVPGIFAAGDCVDDIYRQAIIAAGDGAKAGLDAEKWLRNQ
ncbi:MAG: FAD-dependent oxidoreductase [Candidatus Shapirobacteria bacterium]|nr:FAD-dependent oxidoreductase [Candidatus Shapirobacteria bacterium]